ncbi:CDP-2,3-bis-(O-geranylgeranyl)-sn-glycerol synthase [Candidatus Woesearchaeota archaeon]|nr:CDP-2,3-bis-(O-geranylgeranyl)-sn-glycerol synthase [Candidatus Woesearchaeota archaeon]
MIEIILISIYFMLPAYFANMIPVFAAKLKFLNYPVDFGKKFKGKPIFGSHKTWRGLFFGVITGIIIAYLQKLLYIYPFFSSISLVDYSNWLALGFLLGFGALIGDLVKSFFKRRAGVKAGQRFIPWDQLDYTIGSLLFVFIVFIPSWQIIAAIVVINFILHVIANHLAYYAKLSDVKW